MYARKKIKKCKENLCVLLLGRATGPTQNHFPWDLLATAVPSFALELPSPWTLNLLLLNNRLVTCRAMQHACGNVWGVWEMAPMMMEIVGLQQAWLNCKKVSMPMD